MGQAKNRRTYNQRVVQAQARNVALATELNKLTDDAPIRKIHDKIGTQKLSTKLIMCGCMVHTYTNKPL